MIEIPSRNLPSEISKLLEGYQAEIDALPAYAERVAEAKKRFSSRNRPDDKVFSSVRQTLDEMCSGSRRCMYCEDSAADEVEHIKPKDLYPEAVFIWANYLYACGRCNGGKNNKYAVWDEQTNTEIIVTRQKKAPIIPPQAGLPLLIDPRIENPLDFLFLDLRGTYIFHPHPHLKAGFAKKRAEYTKEILGLNRDVLIEARREAFENYVARLKVYLGDKQKLALLRMSHPTVWLEIKRQHQGIDHLSKLFAALPEALKW